MRAVGEGRRPPSQGLSIMTNAIERANAQGMPSDRRGFLRGALAIGATAAAGAPAALAALPPETAAASAPIATKLEAEGLIEIGRRIAGLLEEFWQAADELRAAQVRFNEIAPLPPKPRKRARIANERMFKTPFVKIVRGQPAPYSSTSPMETSAAHAHEVLWDAAVSDDGSELTRKEIYQVSERYQWKLFSAAKDCGLADALTRFRKAGYELRKVAGQAFEFKPETRLGVAAQAFALVGALEAQDGRAGKTFAGQLAASLLEDEGQLDPDNMTLLASAVRDA
jgi:hypothetical protein